jgi:hypothetical protein
MSTADQRLTELRRNYLQAIENRAEDLADSKSKEEAIKIINNVNAARDALLEAIEAGLSGNAAAIEAAYKALAAGNQEIEAARKAQEKLVSMLKKLAGATSAATGLAKALGKANKK